MDNESLEGARNAASDALHEARRRGRRMMEDSYDTVREYGDRSLEYASELSETLTSFVKRDPLIAVAGAFLVGYIAAHLLRRLSS